jgi:hypothetical protein
METYSLKVKNIRLYVDETTAKVTITFEEKIPGIIRTDAGEFIHGDVDHMSISRSAFTAQVCDVNDDIALFRACCERPFTQKELAILFLGSTVKFNTAPVVAGEVINGVAVEHDFYTIEITNVKLTTRAEDQLNAALTLD